MDASLPLVLFLRGAGERRSNNRDQVDHYIDGLISATQSDRFASFLLAPQVPTGQNWTTERAITMKLLADVQRDYNVDDARRYVTGLSLGGFGTFSFMEDGLGNPMEPVSLFHSVVEMMSFLLPPSSDYESADYADALRDLVGPTSECGRYYELDVTDLVLTDYAMDGDNPLSAFRLQVAGVPFVDDGQGARCRFTMPGAQANHPELVLNFVPEPSTAGLVLLSAIWVTTFGRWRRQ